MNRSSRLCAWLAALAVLPSLSAAALAQDYPARPVRVIATSSAGGTSDIFMRALADELHKAMG
jgi:tripartite-type tricarboxylate transporter receptor subunit TctC